MKVVKRPTLCLKASPRPPSFVPHFASLVPSLVRNIPTDHDQMRHRRTLNPTTLGRLPLIVSAPPPPPAILFASNLLCVFPRFLRFASILICVAPQIFSFPGLFFL